MNTCKMSVRSLVESVYQSGDLISTSSSNERANLGSIIHRQLQAAAGKEYESEVYLKNITVIENISFEIEGRADGIVKENDHILIDEIKTTALPYEMIDDTHFIHFAQAYCYGYFYLLDHPCDEVTIRVRYYQIETHQIKSFEQVKSLQELETFYLDTLQRYKRWADLKIELETTAQKSLKDLKFPFAKYRQGQREFAVAVYKTILDQDVLFAQAPTGIGKTISTLFPALKAKGEGKCEKIFYLCAKNITAQVAYDTIALLYEQGHHFKTVGINAKDKVCFLEKRNCDPSLCPYAKGYYDRSQNALYEVLTTLDFITHDRIKEIAQKHRVCPFELILDASLYGDVIVGDYNYVFDPRVYLKRFFMEKGNYVFFVDEAHNLVDRAREMYSSQLLKSDFLHLKALIPKARKPLQKSLTAINSQFLRLKKLCEKENTPFFNQSDPLLRMQDLLANFIEHMDAYLESEHNEEHEDTLREVYFNAINYNRIAEFYDDHFKTCIQLQDKDVLLRQYCMDPSRPLLQMQKKGIATIFFSATLSPIEYYLTLLGGNSDTKRLSLPSPFPKENVEVMIANQISTRYRNREESLQQIVSMIGACINECAGNYIVFAPSYTYMNQIAQCFIQSYPDILVTIQDSMMDMESRNQFLKQFEETDHLHIYFCVMGGMFSEGIDLKGEKLIGAILIGVGLPQINPWLDLIKDHFNQENHMGYAYAYQFPGLNKVLQSAGRVIRSIEDKGILLFIDERYTTNQYKGLLPTHLQQYHIVSNNDQVAKLCHNFWQKEKGK